jgi:hypothetical protein
MEISCMYTFKDCILLPALIFNIALQISIGY